MVVSGLDSVLVVVAVSPVVEVEAGVLPVFFFRDESFCPSAVVSLFRFFFPSPSPVLGGGDCCCFDWNCINRRNSRGVSSSSWLLFLVSYFLISLAFSSRFFFPVALDLAVRSRAGSGFATRPGGRL